MKDERMVELLAEIEGLERTGDEAYPYLENTQHGVTRLHESAVPRYLSDHNALQRILEGMDWKVLHEYVDALALICIAKKDTLDVQINNSYKATCRQKAEAILKALGKWEEDA